MAANEQYLKPLTRSSPLYPTLKSVCFRDFQAESISLCLIVSYETLPTIQAPFWLLMSSLVIAVQIAYLRVDVAL